MKLSNYLRDWNAYGEGWHVRVQMDASDDDRLAIAANQLRMIAASLIESINEGESDGTE
jgi:hypothetical protein